VPVDGRHPCTRCQPILAYINTLYQLARPGPHFGCDFLGHSIAIPFPLWGLWPLPFMQGRHASISRKSRLLTFSLSGVPPTCFFFLAMTEKCQESSFSFSALTGWHSTVTVNTFRGGAERLLTSEQQ
jgi:hypothetical protein